MPSTHEVPEAMQRLICSTYAAFNVRDIGSVLATMHPNVDWPNLMNHVRIHGHDAVREYWERQFALIDPRVEPLAMHADANGRIVVDIHQVVRNLEGNIITDGRVQHVYTMRDDLIVRMDVE